MQTITKRRATIIALVSQAIVVGLFLFSFFVVPPIMGGIDRNLNTTAFGKSSIASSCILFGLCLLWPLFCYIAYLTYTNRMPTDATMMLWNDDRQRSMWVLGLPASGKTFALESWILQDVLGGRGCGFLDPTANSFNRMINRIVELLPNHPDLEKKLVIIDPTSYKYTVCFNPLEPIPGIYPERIGKFMTDVVLKIWKMEPDDTPRTTRLLTATFTALSELDLTLLDLPRFLGDRDWRDSKLAKCQTPLVTDYFGYTFPKSDKEADQWITPTLNRLGALIDDRDLRLMFGLPSTINFRSIMDNQQILLVNLSKGIISEGASQLIGAFIVAQIQKAALSRTSAAMGGEFKEYPRFFLYLDEFQNYTTANIQDIIAESRQFGLSLILAHQYIGQLDGKIKQVTTNITGTVCAFLVSDSDAAELARTIFPPGVLDSARPVWKGNRVEAEETKLTQDEIKYQLTRLREREFWYRVKGGDNVPLKLRAFTLPPPRMTDELRTRRVQLIDSVMSRCGKLKSQAQAELKEWRTEDRKFTRPTQKVDDYTDIDTKADEP